MVALASALLTWPLISLVPVRLLEQGFPVQLASMLWTADSPGFEIAMEVGHHFLGHSSGVADCDDHQFSHSPTVPFAG